MLFFRVRQHRPIKKRFDVVECAVDIFKVIAEVVKQFLEASDGPVEVFAESGFLDGFYRCDRLFNMLDYGFSRKLTFEFTASIAMAADLGSRPFGKLRLDLFPTIEETLDGA